MAGEHIKRPSLLDLKTTKIFIFSFIFIYTTYLMVTIMKIIKRFYIDKTRGSYGTLSKKRGRKFKRKKDPLIEGWKNRIKHIE